MSYKSTLLIALLFFLFSFPSVSEANRYESNGYKVELYWKVKRDYLEIWGKVEEGEQCARLDVYAHLTNDRYDYPSYAKLDTVIKKPHYPKSRSYFSGEYKIRSNRMKNGWFVDRLDISCSGVKPID